MRKLFESGVGGTTRKIIGYRTHRSHRVRDNVHSQDKVENIIISEVTVSNTIEAFKVNIRVLRRIFPKQGVKFSPIINTF